MAKKRLIRHLNVRARDGVESAMSTTMAHLLCLGYILVGFVIFVLNPNVSNVLIVIIFLILGCLMLFLTTILKTLHKKYN